MKIQGDGAKLTATAIDALTTGTAQRIQKQILSALPPWTNGLAIDLSGLEQIDDSGLQTLRNLHRELESRGVTLRIVSASAAAREAFESADLADLPPIIPEPAP